MPYMERSWISKNQKFMIKEKYHSMKVMPQNSVIREKRKKRCGSTSVSQEQINLRHRVKELTRLIMDNFEGGDWWLTFQLEEKVSIKEFNKAYQQMMKKLREFSVKHGRTLKYIAVKENLYGGGRMHGHMLIPGWMKFSELKKVLKKAWKLGNTFVKPFAGEAMDARRLAGYMCKEDPVNVAIEERARLMAAGEATGEFDKKAIAKLEREIKKTRSVLCPSKNLTRTKPVKKKITKSETYRDEIKPPKGYQVVKELSYNGWTQDGYPYQHAVFERSD